MKILISAYTGLGNFVMKTPLIAALRHHYPQAKIDLITGNTFGVADLAKYNPSLNHVHELPITASWLDKLHFFQHHLCPIQYDYLLLPFDAQPNFLLVGSYVAQIGCRIRHPSISNHWKDKAIELLQQVMSPSYPTETVPLLPAYHETAKNCDLADRLAQQSIERNFGTQVFYPTKANTLERFGIVPQQANIVVQCGAANGVFRVKTWQAERFVALFRLILEQLPDYQLILVGDKGDDETSIRPILAQLPSNSRLINTAGQTSIVDLLHILDNANVIICHDSGVMHLGDALQKPLLALWGPTDYQRTRPLRASSKILVSQTPYTYCMYNFATNEAELSAKGIGHAAMNGISVEQVMEQLLLLTK